MKSKEDNVDRTPHTHTSSQPYSTCDGGGGGGGGDREGGRGGGSRRRGENVGAMTTRTADEPL